MSRWFRLYDALLDDPKVQRLSGDDFKGWVNLLCLASRNGGKLPSHDDIAFALRVDVNAVSTLLERLLNGGLIERRNGGANGMHYAPYKWAERQYKSDTSTERVKRFRQRSETATETPPETETEQKVIPLSNDNGETDQEFWAAAKLFIAGETKGDPGKLIGAWCRDHGKPEVAQAFTRAQLERPVQRVPFIIGCLKRGGSLTRPRIPI